MTDWLNDDQLEARIMCDRLVEPTGMALNSIQPASVDMHLGDSLLVQKPGQVINMQYPERIQYTGTEHVGEFQLKPGAFILGTTQETVNCPVDLVGQLVGKSTVARHGLFVHVCAGFIDPGFSGQITLELYNASSNTLVLTPGMTIAQLVFSKIDPPAYPYGSKEAGSHYQFQTGATAPKGDLK
ncbi:dCTP deaminase [Bifidobacterium castoris]|uniref:Deoxycytidine triphosphate deaminase n=1 Tax=Bifidobacterium castoris TaxID=2306972 RepID=A0A430F4J4_9BIFI|nr:dCTP deaminase [Bifidobacterium castoris]RSX44674.1 deoxycytidine triphosphate deaminase [Bifidobacterium castoris]